MYKYDEKSFVSRHEQDEGILNKKTNKKYPNTLTAMIEAEELNDLVGYTDLDISERSSLSIKQLYIDRFEQLRNANNYLELWWGGGYDSTNILEVSIECGQPVDSITMYGKNDPWTHTAGPNTELSANIGYINKYIKKFPKTKINVLDIDEMWHISKNRKNDYHAWACASPYAYLEDMARLSADDLLPERNRQQGTIITGKGYGGVVYNRGLDIWSYYSPCTNINYPGAVSNHLPITRFYHEPKIIRTTAEQARAWFYQYQPEFDRVWTTTEKWDHENIRYPDLRNRITHTGKGDLWITNPKYVHLLDDADSRSTYKEYWDYLDWVDSMLAPEMFAKPSRWLGNELRRVYQLRQVSPPVLDF